MSENSIESRAAIQCSYETNYFGINRLLFVFMFYLALFQDVFITIFV